MTDQEQVRSPMGSEEKSVTDVVPVSSPLSSSDNQDGPPPPKRRKAPEEVRCIAWKRTCVCGHKFPGTDLYGGKTKSKSNRIKGQPPDCTECGRPRERCRLRVVPGATTCKFHGGSGIVRKAFVPGYEHMGDEKILTLEAMIEEDDTTLKREFHTLRIYFGDAMEQFEEAIKTQRAIQATWEEAQKKLVKDGVTPANLPPPFSVDLIGEGQRLAGMIDKLSSISEKRSKIRELPSERLVRVQFDDPKMKYVIKEVMRDMEIKTIKQVVAVMLSSLDPTGELGLVERLPSSFIPYLPPSSMEVSNVSVAGE